MSKLITPKVSVIIVNYNTADFISICIESLKKQTQIPIEIIVVDNASTDQSIEVLESVKINNFKLIKSSENIGFGRANNLAAKSATGDFLLLLNPDTTLDSPTTIIDLVNYYDQNSFGLLAPLINEPRKSKFVLPKYKYPGQKYAIFTRFNHLPGKIAWVLGACILLKKHIYDELDGFDPDFFLYGEDVDLCLRARKLGYQIGFEADIQISHIGGASEFKSENLDKWIRKRRGGFLFLKKHYHKLDLRISYIKLFISALIGISTNKSKKIFNLGDLEKCNDKIQRHSATLKCLNELL